MNTQEELRLQLAEAGFANAIPEMVKSAQDIGLISKELGLVQATQEFYDLQQQGKIITEEILPAFTKRMKDFASAGLEQKLNSNTVTMGRFFNVLESSAELFFQSGFAEGLTDFFNTTAKMIKENEHTWKALGKIVGGVLKGISFVIENVVAPVLDALGSILTFVTDIFKEFSAIALVAFSPTFWAAATGAMKMGFGAVAAVLTPLLLKFTAIAAVVTLVIGLLEEVAEFFSPTGKRTLIGTNINEITAKYSDFFDKVSKVISAVTGSTGEEVKSPKAQDALKVMYGSRPPSAFTGQQGYVPPTIRVEVPVHIDGEKVGQAVMDSESGREGVRREMNTAIPRAF